MDHREIVRRVIAVRDLTESTYVLRFERGGMQFQPGQHIDVGLPKDTVMRKYSIYSTPKDDFMEILVREVRDGRVTPRLRKLGSADEIEVEGPTGMFLINEEERRSKEFLFVATGTGISPFHSFAGSYPDLNYKLIHGIRYHHELYEHKVFDRSRVVSCVSREKPEDAPSQNGNYGGETVILGSRVTDYLDKNPPSKATHCYLCGNADMIYDVSDQLKAHGIPPEQIFAEEYF